MKLIACAALVALGVLASGCAPSKPAAPPPPAPKLWGDMVPVVSVKELMRDLIDPLADNIFESVGTIVDKKGIRDWAPKTDEASPPC